MEITETVQVTAPSDLNEGYQFDATIDGKTFPVTVPAGGVKAGQIIEVPYPHDVTPMEMEQAAGDGALTVSEGGLAPTGQWRNELCDCFDTCSSGIFWMGWCFTGILLGQLMQRLKLNVGGSPTSNYENTCITVTIITIVCLVLGLILLAATQVGVVVVYVYVIFLIVVGTLTRMYMRKKYQIPASACGESCLDDCCCMYWCTCCSVIQMARHTHDEKMYSYHCGSKTGLGPEAPEIV